MKKLTEAQKEKLWKAGKKVPHRHRWDSDGDSCPSCGYWEEHCTYKYCATSRDGKTKEIVSE